MSEDEPHQYWLHVIDWSIWRSRGCPAPDRSVGYVDRDRYNRDDLNTRCNWDLPS